jgi:hypothetical protein
VYCIDRFQSELLHAGLVLSSIDAKKNRLATEILPTALKDPISYSISTVTHRY